MDQAVQAEGNRQWLAVGSLGGIDKQSFLISQSAQSPCGCVGGV